MNEETAPSGTITDEEFQSQVSRIIGKLRPFLQYDGGDIEILGFEGRNVRVRLVGACAGCPSAVITLRYSIEQKLRDEVPEFGELIEETGPVGPSIHDML
jgi:Fe-S cluster biogenesis protein NfuA